MSTVDSARRVRVVDTSGSRRARLRPLPLTAEVLASDRPDDRRVESVELTAVPYYTWANREPGTMRVWLMDR